MYSSNDLNKTELSTHWRALIWNPAIQSRITLRYLLCSRSVQKMSKKEKKNLRILNNTDFHIPLHLCIGRIPLIPRELTISLVFNIFDVSILVSVCFVWCWIYLLDHLTNNWHFRAYIIKGFCDGWGGGSFIIVICLFFYLLVYFFFDSLNDFLN